ncbi:MAG: hypothetical protein ABIH35_01215 [Patescibacteria group bacterium]
MSEINSRPFRNEFLPKNFWLEKRTVFLKTTPNIKKEIIDEFETVGRKDELDQVEAWLDAKKKSGADIPSVAVFDDLKTAFPSLAPKHFAEIAKITTGKDDYKIAFMKLMKEKINVHKNIKAKAAALDTQLQSDYEFDIDRLDTYIKKTYGNKKEHLKFSDPDNWFDDDDTTKKVYEHFFGKSGVIRRQGKNGRDVGNIFGSDVNPANSNYLQIIRGRLILAKEAYAERRPKRHPGLSEARKNSLEKNKNIREGMVFQVINGNFQEAVKTFNAAPDKDKWKYAVCAGILAIGLFKLIKYVYKKAPKATLGAIVLYAANTLSGIASKDKKTLLERAWFSKENPDDVTKTILSRMEKGQKEKREEIIGDDSEEIRAMLNFGGVKITHLCDAYLQAKTPGGADKKGFKEILTRRLKRVEGKRQWIQPEVAYKTLDGYFKHMGRKYFKSAKESGYLTLLIQQSKKAGKEGFEINGDIHREIPTDSQSQINLGINFFRKRHSEGGRDHTFFTANWAEVFRESPEKYFLSIPDFIRGEIRKDYLWWGENHAEVGNWLTGKGIEFKRFVWDQGLVESWKYLKPQLSGLKQHPFKSIAYVGEQLWEITFEGGEKIVVPIKKAGGNILREALDFWKDNYNTVIKDYWKDLGLDVGDTWIEQDPLTGDLELKAVYKKRLIRIKSVTTDIAKGARQYTLEFADKKFIAAKSKAGDALSELWKKALPHLKKLRAKGAGTTTP